MFDAYFHLHLSATRLFLLLLIDCYDNCDKIL